MIDLGEMPLANSYLRAEDLEREERRYPLRVRVCEECLLAQLDTSVDAVGLFSDYAYFSSYSESWLAHASRFAENATIRFGLSASSLVLEIASNDGYLLTNFVQRGIPSLGIEPAANVAAAAMARGVPTRVAFFNRSTAESLEAEGLHATQIIANNVLAHVPDTNDLLGGVALVLEPGGVASFEFPHLLRLIDDGQFDTIYHEHYSYLSMLAVERLFARNGLEVFDVEELPTHGGSLRVYAQHPGGPQRRTRTPDAVRDREIAAGLDRPETYGRLAVRAERIRLALVGFLQQARREGKRVVAYGAPAKGNTLLNFCGVGPDLIVATADKSPHKQGRYLPGTHIPVLAPAILPELRPDYVLILPWNLREEIMQQLSWMAAYGGQFLMAIPELRVLAPLCGFTL
jgi:SAM-dependent methyltransferase